MVENVRISGDQLEDMVKIHKHFTRDGNLIVEVGLRDEASRTYTVHMHEMIDDGEGCDVDVEDYDVSLDGGVFMSSLREV